MRLQHSNGQVFVSVIETYQLDADPTKANYAVGTDYPGSTTNTQTITVTVQQDGTITANATCAGAANGVQVNCNQSGGSLQCNVQ